LSWIRIDIGTLYHEYQLYGGNLQNTKMNRESDRQTVLVHLASGVGNIVLATPLLVALGQMKFTVDVLLDADYAGTADLLHPWGVIREIYVGGAKGRTTLNAYDVLIPAIPPFYWPRFADFYRNAPRTVRRPPEAVFYHNEQEYYLAFARALGYPVDRRPLYRLPIAPSKDFGLTARTVALAPGCKSGEMAAKRWPYFPQLAERFEDVAIVGTSDDLCRYDGRGWQFPHHVRLFIDRLSLRETAEVLASAAVVVGNDSGLSHMAGALGTPTVMLFGPTPHRSLGALAPNVKVLRTGLACEPCWFGARLRACAAQMHCLHQLTVDTVEQEVRRLLALDPGEGHAD
jgi:ADP-heptose:LPS heptosyltransferase